MELNGQNEGTKNGLEASTNIESNEVHKVPYPKRIFFIIGTEFCERFNYFGMRTILVLYLKYKLDYTENDATVLYHGFTSVGFFIGLFFGIISDVWLGKFKTILNAAIIFAIGSTIISLSSIPTLNVSPKICLLIGLVFVAIGGGGIKPCVAAFGGDQFKLPEQAAKMATYFSLFYFTINLGALVAATIIPVLRKDVHCFGDEDCFPLAFGVPSILMAVAILFFLAGRSSYTAKKISSENILVQVTKCITNAISTKFRESHKSPRKNLLDYSIDKYGEELVGDTRSLLQILMLYLPLPLFWALFEQQGSRWTFQADRMNGDIGFYTIKPDQMQMSNPILIFILIPIFETMIYPILHRIGIRNPLHKMLIGGILAAIAFLLSASVQFKIDSSPDRSVHMLWLFPQYFVISLAEVLLSATGLSFSYEQAPESMKSIIMAFWSLNIGIGNLILLFIAELDFFDSQAHEFLLFSGLMFVDMLIFMYLTIKYKSNTRTEVNLEEDQSSKFEKLGTSIHR